MIQFYNKRWLGWFYGLCVYPILIWRDSEDEVQPWQRRHEMEHVRQQKREPVLYFIKYGYYFMRSYCAGLGWKESYMRIPYEVEARKAEHV